MQENTVVLEANEAEREETRAEAGDVKRGWIRFGEERRFGSVTGGDFQVWGEE